MISSINQSLSFSLSLSIYLSIYQEQQADPTSAGAAGRPNFSSSSSSNKPTQLQLQQQADQTSAAAAGRPNFSSSSRPTQLQQQQQQQQQADPTLAAAAAAGRPNIISSSRPTQFQQQQQADMTSVAAAGRPNFSSSSNNRLHDSTSLHSATWTKRLHQRRPRRSSLSLFLSADALFTKVPTSGHRLDLEHHCSIRPTSELSL
ncbi:unnamed protein product [Acanthosepion pharaonis]|uniref:Uncharacterized protein n=1 Tax=Acanthosepion pharaonis TaxID=158019 RepID=A0A812CRF7_ACAPH|nr:unnamed protein product [Sepia pharaonis]